MKRVFISLLTLVIFLLPAYAQQTNISRYMVFTGYSYLTTPLIGLNQNGFDGSFGINANRWLGLGTDFSVFKGSTNIGFGSTTLGAQLTPITPPGFPAGLSGVFAPTSQTTYVWGAGPKANLRKWKKLTLFAHPGLGLMHASANLNTTSVNEQLNALAQANPAAVPVLQSAGVQAVLAKLQPHLTDTAPFFGLGVGFDINASRHVGLRFTTDWVRSHMFSNLLNWQDDVRLSVGPIWGFGEVSPRTR
jgi:hypothetical protein